MVQTRRQAAAAPDAVLMTADQLPSPRQRRKPICQDCPPRPMLAFVNEEDFPKVERRDDERPPSRCTIPPSAGVETKICQGWDKKYKNALRPEHGRNFKVCVHCAERNWDVFTWTRKPYSVDLCRPCSVQRRGLGFNLGDGSTDCVCHINRIDKAVHLCTGCRQEQQEDEYQVLGERALVHMRHIYCPKGEYCSPSNCTRISHYIDNSHRPFGESGCICSLNDADKLETYDVDGVLDFSDMVRVCLHCGRDIYVIKRPTYYPPEET